MRLIDADALKEIIGECPENWTDSPEEVEAFNMWHRIMNDIDSTPTICGWVSVKDRLPEEKESMFAKFHATEKWSRAMWLKESETVLVGVAFPDGGQKVTVGRLHDGKWSTTVSQVIPHTVTHWMPLPTPPEEVSGDVP